MKGEAPFRGELPRLQHASVGRLRGPCTSLSATKSLKLARFTSSPGLASAATCFFLLTRNSGWKVLSLLQNLFCFLLTVPPAQAQYPHRAEGREGNPPPSQKIDSRKSSTWLPQPSQLHTSSFRRSGQASGPSHSRTVRTKPGGSLQGQLNLCF